MSVIKLKKENEVLRWFIGSQSKTVQISLVL